MLLRRGHSRRPPSSFLPPPSSLPPLAKATRLLAARCWTILALACAATAFVITRRRIGAVMLVLPHTLLARTHVSPYSTT